MTRKEILDTADKCVNGDRDKQYGSPENSFSVIAEFWSTYIETIRYFRGFKPFSLTAKDIAAMMVLFKVARIATGQDKEDNWVDIAGYAACGGELLK